MASQDPAVEPLQVLLLVGLVGSGKTALAQALENTGNWVRASQDDAPNRKRQEAEAMTRRALREKRNVVIDRVNFDRKQRSHFIEIARENPNVQCTCVILDVKRETLEARLAKRTGHPTLVDVDIAMRVLGQMQREYKPPQPDAPEGYSRVYILPEEEQPEEGLWTDAHLQQLLNRIQYSRWRDEPYVAPPQRQSSHGARKGYLGPEGNISGNRGGFIPQGPPRGYYGNGRGRAQPQYENGRSYGMRPDPNLYTYSPASSAVQSQRQADRSQFRGSPASRQRGGDRTTWKPPGRPDLGAPYISAGGTFRTSPIQADSGSGHLPGQSRPPYRSQDSRSGHYQANHGFHSGTQRTSNDDVAGIRQAPLATKHREKDPEQPVASHVTSVETTAGLELPLHTLAAAATSSRATM
ncbi:hypothetical protein NliqN6_4923 [Naganishia liquefaciens]|uniref:Uncharacterized protein n=1 Tax=Naganishia liquefaciens TaxID=104408 RepID=A0A8H3TX47_9TREE|nr:hypothetical protein NliqN6_4923 [Naganishia liquefaciens]